MDEFSDTIKDAESSEVGRPSSYDPKYCEGIVDWFLDHEIYHLKKTKHFGKDGELQRETSVKEPLPPPTFYKYATHIGVCRDTLHEWSTTHDEFKKAYAIAKSYQASFITSSAMCNIANTSFSIFMMKNNHGWSDRIEQKIDQRTTLESLIEGSMTAEEKG